jgi:hypothetical protein
MELKYVAFHYVNTCFKCVIISRTEYSFLSKQSVKSVRKTAGFLSLNRISELIWDNESYKTRAPRDISSDDEGSFEDKSGMSHLQPDRLTTRVLFLQIPLIKRKIFRVCRSKHHPLRSGHGSLSLTEVQYTNLVGAPERKKAMKRRI